MDATEEIQIVRDELEKAFDVFVTASEQGLKLLAAARRGEPVDINGLQQAFFAILEGCAYQDLTGQRLERLAATPAISARRAADPLLNGPADPGSGLDQAAADRLFGA